LKQTEKIFLSEGAPFLALRCRMQHCLTQLFDAVYWMEHVDKLTVQESGENSGKELQNKNQQNAQDKITNGS
jgi:hypothetical protein